jgi:hypothetical protein
MGDEELSHGEIARALKRHDEQLAEKASKEALAEFKGEVRTNFKRVEGLAVERRDALREKDEDLDERIDGVNARIDGTEKGRTAKAANWIAFSLLLLTAIGLIVTVLSHGGK